jgi:aldehyde dehydrogenase (NAD+)
METLLMETRSTVFRLLHADSLYIGGTWEPVPESDDVVNPATERAFATAPVGTPDAAKAAVAAARTAFDHGPWPRLPAAERHAVLSRFLDAIDRRREEICRLIVAEAGATLAFARSRQFAVPMTLARFMVDAARRDPVTALPPELTPSPDGGSILGAGVVVREPVGVVAAITPYNVPFFLNVAKSVPAMAAGCTVVLKPSPFTPLQALVLGEIADEARLPGGVLNIVTGGPDVGAVLTSDRDVDLVTFTGSDRVAEAILAQAAPTLKRVLLELGGKSAMIVRADADLDRAAAEGLRGFTAHCGQGCQLPTRHLVHNAVRSSYVEKVAAMAAVLRIGDPADPDVDIGPLIRSTQRDRTEEFVASAIDEGADLVTGGRRPPDRPVGYFYEPTLFDGVDNTSRLAQEEVFGPVGAVIGFDTDEEAVAIANDSSYGLSGGVHSADVGRAYEIALQLRTGGVSVNGGAGTILRTAPFGGIRRSGFGREFGVDGLNEFTYTKSVTFRAG